MSIHEEKILSDIPKHDSHSMHYHHRVSNTKDKIAIFLVKFAVKFADVFFRQRYGHRAVVLETIAAVPGMVGGLFQHLKSLRQMKDDRGFIKKLLEEAENERMHLMIFVHVARPNIAERILIVIAQVFFYAIYTLIYLISSETAHRTVGYLEEAAVHSYSEYLKQVTENERLNTKAPKVALDYYGLNENVKLKDVILKVRIDEEHHRDQNHMFANKLNKEPLF